MENTGREPMQKNTTKPEMVAKTQEQKKEMFEEIVHHYLESNPLVKKNYKASELEIRFGTNPKIARPVSKINYDNVVRQIQGCGFASSNPSGEQMLRIQNEYTDLRTGQIKMSNVRAEIVGSDLIQEYCKTNSLQKLIDMPSTTFNKLKFTQKMGATAANGEVIRKLDMEDYNFRVSFQTEQDFHMQTNLARNILSKWNDSKKMFRCMNRVRFAHPDYPVFVDLSIVKMSKRINYVPVPHYTVQEADVFNGVEMYEIELEVDNMRVGAGTDYTTAKQLMVALRKCIRIVLSGLQETNYPISYPERDVVLRSYLRLIHGPEYNVGRRIYPKDFMGPGSYTLQMENLQEDKNSETSIPNIRNQYTVTDKADGERKLLYIADDGKIYLIDTNMNVIFTGTKTKEKTLYNSMVDGEHIKYDKEGTFINLYAAFDVYYIHEKSVREYPFIPPNEESMETKYRLPLLHKLTELINPVSILENKVDKKQTLPLGHFHVRCKSFYSASDSASIFDGCAKILSNVSDGTFEYTTDGLIFTPSDFAVGGNSVDGPPGPLTKSTWEHSFKWKPAEFNTIDFLVSVRKNKMGRDEIHHVFQDGKNLQGVQTVLQYKTLELRCGFDERKHGYMNPCQNILNDEIPSPDDLDNEETYKPVPFQPTNPYDENAHICNVFLKEDGTRLFMTTEEGEYFEEDTIVECKYVATNDDGWRWVPLRVRYDKTAELRAGLKNYGNAYHVANNNWHSIHHPITEEMITSGQNIPEQIGSEEVYYNRSSQETSTQALRDFHNLYVKSKLITSVSKRGDSLIDYAVGKAGDLSKWTRSNLGFVFGIDVSKDNIHNQLDGACARYLKARKKYKNMFGGLFVVGDSGLNVRSGDALSTEKDKQVINAIFGRGPKDAVQLGKGVYKYYGIAEPGFQVSSCQFAMHYFFENASTVHSFLRNISECTKVGGYYVGTCYDGRTVFDTLYKKKKEEGVAIFKEDRKIYEITKMYDQTGFPDDELSLGYAINVYQESINKVFREYLVNFDYLVQLMEDYGFVLVSKEDAQHMNMPSGSALFSELFSYMENEIEQNPKVKTNYRTASRMSPEERRISFMNRYFMFQKVRNVDAKKIGEVVQKQSRYIDRNGEEPNVDAIKPVEDVPTVVAKNTNRRLVLKKFDVSNEE